VLWFVAVVTSALTAVYMFRLVYLAFHGEPAPSAAGADRHHPLHDAPPSMAIPLIVLAIGSVFAGYVGVPHAVGGSNRIEAFLEPSFEAHAAAEPEAVPESLERALMAVSSVAAVGGIALATWLFLKRRDRAEAVARAAPGVYRTLLHKYYVDEIYDALIVQPIKRVSTGALWRGVDAGLIDGAVDGAGAVVRGASATLRRVQTGSVRAYAASLFLGVVVILGYYLWR
jgi:NADH-quinone oxidoreductase subunit L